MLMENSYIRKVQVKNKSYAYEIVSYQEYEKLQSSIAGVLDGVLQSIKEKISAKGRVQGSKEVQTQNEPSKSLKENKKKTEKGKVHHKQETAP